MPVELASSSASVFSATVIEADEIVILADETVRWYSRFFLT